LLPTRTATEGAEPEATFKVKVSVPCPQCSLLALTAPRAQMLQPDALDFVFFSARSLKCTRTLPVPRLAADQFIPSAIHPSDHLPVGATFELI